MPDRAAKRITRIHSALLPLSPYISPYILFPSSPFPSVDNGLSGTVPAELAVLPSLRNVQLQENSIGGTVPSALCDQVSPLGEITTLNTDCGGDDPTIQCDCCTRCFRVNRGTGMSEEVEVP